MTQTDAILSALKNGERLTPLDALDRFQCMRLGARIWELKQQGHAIQERTVERNGKHFSEYWMDGTKTIEIVPPRAQEAQETLFGNIEPQPFFR